LKREFKGKDKFGNWTLLAKIYSGGNGEVWFCKNDIGDKKAIKLLKKDHNTAFQRFTDEVDTILSNQDVKGVIRIEDWYLPDDFKKHTPFYVMPIGQSFNDTIKGKDFNYKIEIAIKIVECLGKLHARGIVHRIIKPANLLFINDEPFLIDFGLVDFPDKKNVLKKQGKNWTSLDYGP